MSEENRKLFDKLEKWLLKNVGEKCEIWSTGCFVCSAWRAYEELYDVFNWDLEGWE